MTSHGCNKSDGHCLFNSLKLLYASPNHSNDPLINSWTCFLAFNVFVKGKNPFMNSRCNYSHERKCLLSWESSQVLASLIMKNGNNVSLMMSSGTPFGRNMLHDRTNLIMCVWGSSEGNPLNGSFYTKLMIDRWIGKVFPS